MINNYRRANNSVGRATVHLVWIPKRRKKILIGPVKQRLAEILSEIALENQWIIKTLAIEPDQVHLLVEYDPKTSVAMLVKKLKGRSSKILREEFPHLLRLPSLWTNAYFYETTGKISSAIIEQYINDPHHSH